jgi:omega-6 fatty acid desaturase (delta-12 desaturase)
MSVAMYLALDVSTWLVLALAIPTGGFLLRTYIIFHDCTHGSFMPTKRGNWIVGTITGLMVYSPFASWRHNHQIHHATAGDLDRRGIGDLPTMTVAEYYGGSLAKRVGYRLIRNPLILFGLGPFWSLVVQPRFTDKSARQRIRRSNQATNVALVVLVVGLALLIGWQELLLLQAPMVLFGGGTGVWLFYVQHQFEDTYWQKTEDWSYADAALRGSSYLKLPKVLQFFTGNIGLHHVHHLSAKVPNYHLQAAHDANPVFHDVPTLTLWDGLKAARLKLWDESQGRLVTWREARRSVMGSAAAAQAA